MRIVDFSRNGVNASRQNIPEQYINIDSAFVSVAQKTLFFLIDLADAFYNWKVHAQDRFRLGFWAPGRRQF